MTRIAALVALVLICSSGSPATAQDSSYRKSLSLSAEPFAARTWGKTSYRLELRDASAPVGELSYLASELEYPVNQTMLGVRLNLLSHYEGVGDWRLTLAAAHSVTNPTGTMYDSDWQTQVGGFDGMFSYTESSAEGSVVLLDFEAAKRILGSRQYSVSLTAGVRYQKIEQEIDNFAGWQLVGPRLDYVAFSQTGLAALTYELTYTWLPVGGVALDWYASDKLSMSAGFGMGRVHAEDIDDHLLRFKLSTADGDGYGVLGRVGITLDLPKQTSGLQPFMGFDVDFMSVKVDGTQVQEWYEDELGYVYDEATGDPIIDPETGQPQQEVLAAKGTRITGIPHEFRSTQVSLALRFGFTF